MIRVFIALGSNMGDRRGFLRDAASQISTRAGKIVKASSVYQTAAWGNTNQDAFLNQVIEISTKLDPLKLLSTLQSIELGLGRRRREKWGPRTIDIDILFYGDQIISTGDLTVPHPGVAQRRFVLVPMTEIDGGFADPTSKKTMRELLGENKDELEVNRL